LRKRKIAVRLTLLVATTLLLFIGGQALWALAALDRVERERDTWQRPADVIRVLGVSEGDVVVDFGSGAGYFAVRLAPVVGRTGRVVAIDILRQPLVFLWIRTRLRRAWQVQVVLADEQDPRLPPVPVDAVLIVNTYHELLTPPDTLRRLYRVIKPGGRLVVADRRPPSGHEASREVERAGHRLSPDLAEAEVLAEGFETITRDDRFVDRPEDPWWLLVFRRP
jgi:predicted methyltransferase